MINLTPNESALMALLQDESDANGHDFGVLELIYWDDRKALGGLMTSLQQKGAVVAIDKTTIDGAIVTQYILADEFKN